MTDVAAKIDSQFFGAGGDGVTTPQGLFAWTGVQTLPIGGALTLDHLLDAWGLALAADVNMSALRWVFTPREFVELRKIKDGQDRYQLQPDPTQDGVFRLLGAPGTVTKRVPDATGGTPTGRAALLDFSQVAVARDLAPSVTVLRERYADFDEQALRVVARYDTKPLNPLAVVRLTGIAI
ncbi:phage major capsid protein [Nocardioides sp.]|uniref:phage major capsid protein n=1 Tax=Nocardioides sp. TaxID=35761 RepID=UPI0035174FDE